MSGFTCATCGRHHDELPLCFGAEVPEYYYSVPATERDSRIEMSNDWCVIDETHFFIRGRIEIPITYYPESLVWNVWTSLSEKNFERSQELWHDPLRVQEEPYFGWLQTAIPGYENTINCKTWVHTQPVGSIPQVVVFEDNHPLTEDQHNGITLERARQLVELVLHPKQ
jgi:hypothetical protein